MPQPASLDAIISDKIRLIVAEEGKHVLQLLHFANAESATNKNTVASLCERLNILEDHIKAQTQEISRLKLDNFALNGQKKHQQAAIKDLEAAIGQLQAKIQEYKELWEDASRLAHGNAVAADTVEELLPGVPESRKDAKSQVQVMDLRGSQRHLRHKSGSSVPVEQSLDGWEEVNRASSDRKEKEVTAQNDRSSSSPNSTITVKSPTRDNFLQSLRGRHSELLSSPNTLLPDTAGNTAQRGSVAKPRTSLCKVQLPKLRSDVIENGIPEPSNQPETGDTVTPSCLPSARINSMPPPGGRPQRVRNTPTHFKDFGFVTGRDFVDATSGRALKRQKTQHPATKETSKKPDSQELADQLSDVVANLADELLARFQRPNSTKDKH